MYIDQGNLHKAVTGDYDFSIGEVLSEAWQKVPGSKLKIVGALFVYVIIATLATQFISLFLDSTPYMKTEQYADAFAINTFVGWLASPVTLPLSIGVLLLGYARANDETLAIDTIFNYYVYVWSLVFASLLITIFTYVGFALLLIPGIYLSVSYSFALPLIIDKELGIWGAMEVSRQAVTHAWWTIAGVNGTLFVIVVLSAMPMGVGLIWTIPLLMIAQGVMYRKIFGWNVHDPIATDEASATLSEDTQDISN